MGKKEQVPALRSLCRVLCGCGRRLAGVVLPDGGLALAVFHMVPRVPAAPNLFVHSPADLRNVLLPPSSRPARLLRLTVVCPASSGDGSSIVGRGRRPPRASSQRSLGGRCRLLRLRRPRVCPALDCASFCFVITGVPPLLSLLCTANSASTSALHAWWRCSASKSGTPGPSLVSQIVCLSVCVCLLFVLMYVTNAIHGWRHPGSRAAEGVRHDPSFTAEDSPFGASVLGVIHSKKWSK